jgi:hypothetical protein
MNSHPFICQIEFIDERWREDANGVLIKVKIARDIGEPQLGPWNLLVEEMEDLTILRNNLFDDPKVQANQSVAFEYIPAEMGVGIKAKQTPILPNFNAVRLLKNEDGRLYIAHFCVSSAGRSEDIKAVSS